MRFARFAIPTIAFFVLVGSATAQTVRYIATVDGIGSPGPFQVLSFSWGISNPATFSQGGLGSGRPSVSSLNIMKAFDGNDPLLIDACFTGEHIINLHMRGFRGTNPIPFIDILLEDVLVESHQLSGATNNTLSASVSFEYVKITINGTVLDRSILALHPNAINELVASITKKALATTTVSKKSKLKARNH